MERIRKADGGRLRALREDAWLSQLELSEKSGVAHSTISAIENGKSPNPHNITLKRLAEALAVAPDELVEEREGDSPLEVARARLAQATSVEVGSYRGAAWDLGQGLGQSLGHADGEQAAFGHG